MANGNMAAKMLKLKKQIRALPRKMNQNVYFTEGQHKDPREYELDQDRSVYAPTTQYRARGRGLAAEEAETKFPGVAAGRVEAKIAYDRVRNIIPEMIGFSLLNNSRLKAMLYRNSDSSIFIIMEEDKRSLTVRTTMTYSDRGRIINHWRNGTLRYVIINPKAGSSPSPA